MNRKDRVEPHRCLLCRETNGFVIGRIILAGEDDKPARRLEFVPCPNRKDARSRNHFEVRGERHRISDVEERRNTEAHARKLTEEHDRWLMGKAGERTA